MGERDGYAISKAGGSPLFYEVAGPDNPRETIVLSDGIGCDGFIWKYIRRDLIDNYRLIHWHYPGHGRSPEPERDNYVSIPDLADDLVCVLDDCDVERAVLFGHSMGVQVSLETYRRHVDRVDALALFCGMAENPLKTFQGTGTLEELLPILRVVVETVPTLFHRLARRVLPTRFAHVVAQNVEVNPELLDSEDLIPYLRGLSRVPPQLFLEMLAHAGRHTAVDLLPNIAVPTLVVAGDRDGFTPPELSSALAEQIPDAEFLMVEGGTHTAPLERPHLVNEAVLDFLIRRLNSDNRSHAHREDSRYELDDDLTRPDTEPDSVLHDADSRDLGADPEDR